jgi:16S rRNA (cytidine1402-2'-O)-methyltransferase
MPEDASDNLPTQAFPEPTGAGLVLVSTPIGNLADISSRAIETLRTASLVLCEDTRVTSRLFAAHGIATRLAPLHEHNEDARIPALLALLHKGARIALVSDAGTPLVSDPGYRLVRAAIAQGVPVSAVPGANAATMALILSGLPPHPYVFLGFLPPRQAARRAMLGTVRAAEQAGLSMTLLLHEAPHRLAETLADCRDVLGEREAAVARELTKRYEEVRRDGLGALATYYAAEAPRGEITLVIAPSVETDDKSGLDQKLAAALEAGHSLRDAASLVATSLGLPRKVVYARALSLRESAPLPDQAPE